MRILLVRPGRRKQAITLGEFMFSEPIGLECVFTLLKDDHEVRILDLMAGAEDFLTECGRWKPDAVGFTSLCIDVPGVLELAARAKGFQERVITLVGGTQALVAPESFFCPDMDHVVEYTTAENLGHLFACLERGEKVPLLDGIRSRTHHFQGTGVPGINAYIRPDRTATEKYRSHYSYFGFKPAALMQTSRGCSSMCHFCMRWVIEGNREKDEPLEAIMAQIEEIKESSIMIFDNDFLYNRDRLEKFCDLLEARGIKKNFICYGSVRSILANGPTMKRLRDNGLRAVLVGYESFSNEELAGYHKKATRETNLTAAGILKEYGIDCWASFILHPDWGGDDFKELRKYLKSLRPEISSLTPMTPFPGSSLYHKYRDRVIYPKEEYHRWSYSIVSILPKKISLRRYYFEVLITNLYVNLMLNHASYLVRKFGWRTLFRVAKGSGKFLVIYLRLMLKG
ncbi:B12-binding domain-containing radical SAM protein [Candidatus Formimonas warabiya]|uniref:B12-binding domain-containing radical SAM protein n=1 Tax=Formimonas warabiya TaxID=1761012 RepID=A0A3G1KRG7_FORW1|nr:radical SAM protein [Candidatus Formimonas warabiya]ATW25036.1 B12-binding domain-containing radical SAM protein [Candidatus Formimonas warabiya]